MNSSTVNTRKKMIDCILFTYQEKSYLLPVVAVTEVGVLRDYYSQNTDFSLASLTWRGISLPLLTPDMNSFHKIPKQAKFAIINALFANRSLPPYFAILIDKHPSRLKVKPEDLTWKDEDKKLAIMSESSADPKEYLLLDISLLSSEVEKLIHCPDKSPNNP